MLDARRRLKSSIENRESSIENCGADALEAGNAKMVRQAHHPEQWFDKLTILSEVEGSRGIARLCSGGTYGLHLS